MGCEAVRMYPGKGLAGSHLLAHSGRIELDQRAGSATTARLYISISTVDRPWTSPVNCPDERLGYQEEGLYRIEGAGLVSSSAGFILGFAWNSHVLGQRSKPISVSVLAFNGIGSLLKQWLRELPSEIFPKDAQARIKQAHPAATELLQLMTDELS